MTFKFNNEGNEFTITKVGPFQGDNCTIDAAYQVISTQGEFEYKRWFSDPYFEYYEQFNNSPTIYENYFVLQFKQLIIDYETPNFNRVGLTRDWQIYACIVYCVYKLLDLPIPFWIERT